MNREEFSELSERALDEFEAKRQRQEAEYLESLWAIWESPPGSSKMFFLDQFGQILVEAEKVFIGSYGHVSQTWKWSWSGDDLPEQDRAKSIKVRELAQITGVDAFDIDSTQEADENLCLYFSAMAVHHLKADGFYRVFNDECQTSFFLALLDMRRNLQYQ